MNRAGQMRAVFDQNGLAGKPLFQTGGQAVWNTQGVTSYTPGAGYTQYRDLAGNTTPLAAGASVAIGAKPILVEGRVKSSGEAPKTLPFR